MGKALAKGFLHGNVITRKNLMLSNGDKNIAAAKWADVVIIAVKPKIVKIVVDEIKNYLKKESIVISCAACVSINLLEKYFGQKVKIVRIMPNLPVADDKGVIGWISNKFITDYNKKLFKKIFEPLGLLISCKNDESLDKLSMISGCGPGYVGYFINNLEKQALKYGFSKDESRKIVEATFSGTLSYLARNKISSADLVSSVATKGGITEEVIRNLERGNFYPLLLKSIKKGYDKIERIRKDLES